MEQTTPNSPWFPFVWVDPDRLGGEPCFRGSRVPLKNLFDYLQNGYTVAEFLADFPPVTLVQVEGVLRLTRDGAITAAAA